MREGQSPKSKVQSLKTKVNWFRQAPRVICLVALCLLLSAFGLPGFAADRVSVTILATTDLHGNIYPLDYYANRPANRGLAKISSLVREIRRAKPDALLIDCGDTIDDAPPSYLHQRAIRAVPAAQMARARGEAAPGSRPSLARSDRWIDPMMQVMNHLGYDAMVVGNHEFNFGRPVLWKAWLEAKFPWLSANVAPAASEEEALAIRKRQYGKAAVQMGARTFEPMLLKQVSGVQVAVIGLTTPAIPNWELPENIRGYSFDPAPQAARFWVRHAREVRQADLVVLAAHLGLERDPQTGAPLPQDHPAENAVYQLAVGTPGIDAIVFGHSHRELPHQVLNDVLLVQPRHWGQSLAELTFVLERESEGQRWQVVEKTSRTIPVTDQTPADPEVLALARPYHEEALRYLETPVAQAHAPLDAGLGRVTDNAAVDAIHQVQLAAARAEVSLASLFNPGVRIPRGPVTVRHIAAIYLYYNTLLAVETTGRALKEALEHSARFYNQYTGEGSGSLINSGVFGFNYDTAAGVTYKIDISRPAGQRIVDLRFRGQPLEPDRKLRLALNSYRRSGGGGYGMFRNAPVLWQSSDDIRQLMIDHYSRKKVIDWSSDNNWQIVPEAARRALIAEVEKAQPPAARLQ